MSLQQAVALCMDHCQAAGLTGDVSWFKTVVLTGGTACLPGLAGINQFSTLIAFVSTIVFGLQLLIPKTSFFSQSKSNFLTFTNLKENH